MAKDKTNKVDEDDDEARPFKEQGRRVFAAIMSYQMGVGVDYCLKHYLKGKDVHPIWDKIGEELLRGQMNSFAEMMRQPQAER
jgi:methyl coenzyme M reductase beta subunit